MSSIIHSKTFDNGMICAAEQSAIVLDDIYDAVKNKFAARLLFLKCRRDRIRVRNTILINGTLNAKIVGQSAFKIAALAGFAVPETAKILIGEVESVDLAEAFAHEKLSPVLAMYRAKSYEDALAKAERLRGRRLRAYRLDLHRRDHAEAETIGVRSGHELQS
jgi:acetaldehyde dehydrogenase/alcohol dehydrogenase